MKKELFNKNICILIQGPILNIAKIIELYSDFKSNVIISTNNTDNDSINILINHGFNVFVSELAPISGKSNYNNQCKTTYEGAIKAKQLGFTHVFKTRGDIFISDLPQLLNSMEIDTIYFPAYHNHDGGYLCDYMIFSNVDLMIKLWDVPLSTSNLGPEIQMTSRFDEIKDNSKVDFIFPILYNKNIIAYWEKYSRYLNDYQFDKLFVYERK